MLPATFFSGGTDYRMYLADVEVWGDLVADNMWREHYDSATNEFIHNKEVERRNTRMRHWNELTQPERDNLTVQESRVIVNLLLSDDPKDQEYLGGFLVRTFNHFRRETDPDLKKRCRGALIGEIRSEAYWHLSNRNFPQGGIKYLPEKTEALEDPTVAEPPPNVNPGPVRYVREMGMDQYIHHCSRCHSDVIGTLKTLEYHQNEVCPELPKNKVRLAAAAAAKEKGEAVRCWN